MKKTLKRILAYTLSLTALSTSAFSAHACAKKTEETNVKLWTAPSYVKIYQDIDYSANEEYLEWYNSADLQISMYKNEKEGGQIILTPDKDVKSYTVSVSNLVAENGAVIDKEKITVYNQKYQDVTFPSKTQTNSTLGMVPDALLPFDKAVEYGENVIEETNNQGIYLEVNSKDVEAGQYYGNVQIGVDGKTYDVATSVCVWDVEVPEENHLKSSFLLRTKELLDNEKDGTDEMYTQYYEQFLDYRVNITKFTQGFDEEPYIEGLRKYYQDPRVATLHFPRCEDSARTSYDFDLAQSWFKKIAELCFEDETNYYSKLYYYLAIIDEPHITNTTKKVVPIYKGFAVARHTVIDELKANRENYDVSNELFDAVVDGIENFPLILTSSYRESYTYEVNKYRNTLDPNDTEIKEENPAERYVITWVPYMSVYDTESSAEKHRNEGIDEWWYSCNYPVNPYPTYHLDDALLTARVFSWMSYEHNVVGNLYWRVNYTSEKNTFGIAEAVEDPYDITNTSQPTNGEGLLVYPGNPYGIYGFIPSWRLVAIRDGMEDYEILRTTGERCKEFAKTAGYENFDINVTFSKLYRALYDGTKISGTAKEFGEVRDLLSKFAMLIENGALIADVQNNAYSTLVKIFVSKGTLNVNGAQASVVEKENGKEYIVEIKQEETANYLDFTLETGDNTVEFKMFVGGKKEAVKLGDISFTSNETRNDLNAVKNQDGSVALTIGALKEKADGTAWDKEIQSVNLSGDILQDTFKKSKGISAIAIEIENPGEAFELSVSYYGTKNPDEPKELYSQSVQADGTTVVLIEMGTFAWESGPFNRIRLDFTYQDAKQERAITIKSMVLTY